MHGYRRRTSIAGILAGLGGFFGLFGPAAAQTSPEQNFQGRCAAPGVVKCLGFDNTTGVTLMGGAKIDNAIKASGAGSMRVDIAPTAGDSPGNIVTKLGADFGEGSSLYLQWRQRFSPEMVDVDLGGEGFKQFVIYDGTPCGPNMEVAMLNQDYGGFPVLYAACGGTYLRKSQGAGNYILMWNQDGTLCTSQNQAGCLRYRPDQWMTFYYEQKIGAWGQPNSVVKVSMAEEGKPLKTFIDFTDFTFKSDKATSAYRDLWLGPYSLGRTANAAYPTARTWFDELIVSRQPIADPSAGSSRARDPRGAAGAAEGLDLRIETAGSRHTLRFTLRLTGSRGRDAEIRIHDRQGRRVARFAGVGDRPVAWDATGTGSGVYLVEARDGNRNVTRKVSVWD